MGIAPDVENRRSGAVISPRTSRYITFHPIHPIPKDEGGFGGGIRVRGTDGDGHEFFFDVVWGEETRLEIVDV